MDPPRKGHRLIVDFKSQFPEKLYDVVNDGYLIHWNRNGSISVKSEEDFEKDVLRLYPGFLQIATFLNFKRLFREYGFDRVVNQNNEYEFSHASFIQGRRDLTRNILTRRKSMRYPVGYKHDEPVVIDTEDGKRYSTRKRKRTTRFNPIVDDSGQDDDDEEEAQGDTGKTYIISHTDMKRYPVVTPAVVNNDSSINKQLQNNTNAGTKQPESPFIGRNQLHNMMDKYAEKEFTEEEYAEWISKRRNDDAIKAKTMKSLDKDINKPKEFWWMYEDKQDTTVSSAVKDKPTSLDHCMPCGFCKCCSAISNYVHIFGEIPENIQVFDYIVEVPAETEVVDNSNLTVENEVIIESQ